MVRASRAHFAHRVLVPYHCGPKVEDRKKAQGRLRHWPRHKFLAGEQEPKSNRHTRAFKSIGEQEFSTWGPGLRWSLLCGFSESCGIGWSLSFPVPLRLRSYLPFFVRTPEMQNICETRLLGAQCLLFRGHVHVWLTILLALVSEGREANWWAGENGVPVTSGIQVNFNFEQDVQTSLGHSSVK